MFSTFFLGSNTVREDAEMARPGQARRRPAERPNLRRAGAAAADDGRAGDALREGRRRLGVVLKPAAQARSRNKLERLLQVGQEMMAEVGFDRMRVVDIAERAGCSTGAFYQRFADKEALLEALAQRFSERAVEVMDNLLLPERFEGQPFAVVIRRVVIAIVRLISNDAVLVREVVRASLRDIGSWAYFSTLRDLFMERLFAVAKLYPEVANRAFSAGPLDLGIQLVLSALLSRSLADPRILAISDDDLAAELATAVIRYLGIEDAPWDSADSPAM